MSLIELFPKNINKIFLVDEYGKIESKTFTPYNSKSRECRIGGLRKFYESYNVVDGDELVIQLLDDEKFRIMPEKLFQSILKDKLVHFENSNNEAEIEKNLCQISNITNLSKIEFLKNDFILLSKEKIGGRNNIEKNKILVKENVPYYIRKILLELYSGKCQITGFTFLTRKNIPYFELHHIAPQKGNHLKNLLVVSPNIHAQFTHANIEQYFDDDGWLRKVKFNNNEFKVFQIIDELQKSFKKEIHF